MLHKECSIAEILLLSSTQIFLVPLQSRRCPSSLILHASFSGTDLTGSADLILQVAKSQTHKLVSSSMYLMFLAVTEAGSLDTTWASNLISLLGLVSNFWKTRDLRFPIQNFEFWIPDFEFWISDFGCQILNFRF